MNEHKDPTAALAAICSEDFSPTHHCSEVEIWASFLETEWLDPTTNRPAKVQEILDRCESPKTYQGMTICNLQKVPLSKISIDYIPRKIDAIKVLREHFTLTLKNAKRKVDKAPFALPPIWTPEASLLVSELMIVEVSVSIVPTSPRY